MQLVIDFINNLMTPIIAELGGVAVMPLVWLILGLSFGIGWRKSITSAITVAIGLAGLYLVLGFFLDSITPAAIAIAERFGGQAPLDIIDANWVFCWGVGYQPVTVLAIVAGVGINLIMLLLRLTKTLNIDIFSDFLGQGLAAAVVFTYTGNVWLAVGIAVIISAYRLLLCDWVFPIVQEHWKIPGVTFSQSGVLEWALLCWPIAKFLDLFPGLREGRFTEEWVRKHFGIFGETVFQGVVFGVLLGILGGLKWTAVILLAVNLAATLTLMPRMISILMEALIPIAEGTRDFMMKRAGGRELYVGMDPALGTGDRAVLAVSMLMVPITVVLALILPGNKILPLGDLATLVFSLQFAVAMNKGDIVRSLITSIILIVPTLYIATAAGPLIFETAKYFNMIDASETTTTSCMFVGGQPYWLVLRAFFGG